MLIIVSLAETMRGFIEHVPTLALLVGVPIGIIALGFFATAVATFVDQQLPFGKP